MSRLVISMGSNIESRIGRLVESMNLLNATGMRLLNVSAVYETSPVGCNFDAPDFLNCVSIFETSFSPFYCLQALNEIETSLGRDRAYKNSPRTIDLDIIFFDDMVIESEKLVVPHPRAHERGFVLRPLDDLMSGFIYPVKKESVNDLLKKISDDTKVVYYSEFPGKENFIQGNGYEFSVCSV